MDEEEAKPLLEKAGVWKPELKDKVLPRVYYLNLPKKFIGGTVYDPVEEEVLIGADVTIKGAKGQTVNVQTDNYGDFWVEGLDDDVFEVTIKQGAKSKVFPGVSTVEADINLGDIPLV